MRFGKAKQKSTYSIDVMKNSEIALFRWSGPITIEDRLRNLKRMVDFCHENGLRKLIIDGRDQESMTNTIESFDFGTEVPKAFRGLKVAVVHRKDDDALKFIETVAANRGSPTRAFVDFDKAREWLDS